MKTIKLTLILTVLSFGTFAQTFEIPNYKLQNAEDYDTSENDIVNCVDWLMKTPINDQVDKRKDANAFLMKWISGSPKVHIEIKQEIVTFMDSPDLLMIFIGTWAKYSIESKDFNNKINGTMTGIESVIDFYTKNKGQISKNKGVEKYIKMKEKGTLKEYVEKNS
ncbi:MAG: hypothetical protein O9302_08310 [Cyclobacteriaceae bacterium]|jgi:hypothetical protein|nr:hypothetical protein [Cytophagales bacterium]MCZ8328048.1 hypothetical protein [Cyclobacteriaceae bacterium]